MAKLSINLLPPELEVEKKRKQRFSATLRLSIVFLVVVVAAATLVLGLRLSQSVVLSNVNKDLTQAKTTLSSTDYSQKEGLADTLKNRLDSIGNLLSQDTYGSYAFNLINSLVPSGVNVVGFNLDAKGKVTLTVQSNDISALSTFFNSLTTPNINQNKIVNVTMEDLNQGKNKIYQTDLVITLVGAPVKGK